MKSIIFAILVGLCLCADLPHLNIDASKVSVSGLSSGGFMAVQYHVAFSDEVMGAGIFAGGPYDCAQGQVWTALYKCMQTYMGSVDVPSLERETSNYFSRGLVDDPANLKDDKVYMFSGTNDNTVKQKVMDYLETYYKDLVGSGNIKYKKDMACGHGIPTMNYGTSCSMTASPYVNNCGYDGAGEALKWIYGTLSAKTTANGNMIEFAQSPFASESLSSISMYRVGHIYVPTACAGGATACKLHISLHGCEQSQDKIQDDWYVHAGYNEWAESNNIVVLYPQVTSDMIKNPKGCWDWWGYLNRDYPDKKGAQMDAIYNMMKHVMSDSAYIAQFIHE